ncbi:hypothetical protein [Pedobacter sp.]|uniref:hypothetical protein n=1 Tax=Pedobacter sp. TaxID=1411316 RepID=UPI003D7F3382
MNWQLITFEQAVQLKALNVSQASKYSWFGNPDHITELNERWIWTDTTEAVNSIDQEHRHDIGVSIPVASAYTLSELAIMLGYSFVPSNVKDAAEKLINEIKTGTSTIKDINARLIEAQSLNLVKQ